jgi:hypothetical protein
MNARTALQALYNRGVEVRLINDGVKLRGVELLSEDELEYLRKMKSDIITELKSAASRIINNSCCICGDSHAPFGVMYSWQDPDKAQWYCTNHYKENCP